MLRLALFITVLSGGAVIFENLGLLDQSEAWLVAGVIAAVLFFLIPETGKSRDPKDLIFSLLGVFMIYGVLLKFRPWLADQTGRGLATVLSVVLLATFVGALIFLITRSRSRSRSDNAA